MAASFGSTASYSPSLPAFLRQSRSDVHAKFVDLEWQQRNRLLQGTQASKDQLSKWSRLSGEAVTLRNRYANVEPYAENRIKLKVAEGASDYINASPVQLGRRKYVATQGPKDINVNHFYRMLMAELRSPAVIVMLTQTHESGKEKCFQYYPLSSQDSPMSIPQDPEDATVFTGEVHLESVEDHIASRSQFRRLKVITSHNSDYQQELDIRHLLFSGWPDFLIPEGEDRAALIELVRLSAALNNTPFTTNSNPGTNGFASKEEDNPRIVHCSAGVGRSGTFIALDYLLSLLYSGQLDNLGEDTDPIADTVDLLRQQRMMMVQGESQFNFLYDVLRERMLAWMQQRDGQATAGAA